MNQLTSPALLLGTHLEEYWMIYALCPATGASLKVWDCKELSLFAGQRGRTLPMTRLYVQVAEISRAGLRPLLAQLETLDPFGRRRLCVDPDNPLP